VVLFLASKDAQFLTGYTLTPDGGSITQRTLRRIGSMPSCGMPGGSLCMSPKIGIGSPPASGVIRCTPHSEKASSSRSRAASG
jgi:hypothetical protein